MQQVESHDADLWERVLQRYDGLVQAGASVQDQDMGALMVTALAGLDPEGDNEPAGMELDARIQRYHLDVCLEHVQANDGVRPSERLLTRCFKGWPLTPKVMLRKLMTPEKRRRKGKPVHGVQQVDLADALFDRICGDAEAEVMMSKERLLPKTETVRAAVHNQAVPVLTAMLRAVGLRHRQIAQLLSSMGALKEGSTSAQEKAVQRAAQDGEALLDGQAPSKRRSLAYTHHPIIEFLLGDEAFLQQLAADPDGAAALLAAAAPDLRAMKVRMALVDFSPTVVNAFRTLDREQWPSVLQRLSEHERTILADYGAERLSRTDAELALGRLGVKEGAPTMRPAWRMFVASSLTRMAVQERADAQDVLREVAALHDAIDEDIAGAPSGQKKVAEAMAEYSRAYLWLDRVDLDLLASDVSSETRSHLHRAEAASRGHRRLAHDLLLRSLTLEVRENEGQPAAVVADLVQPALQKFVASCDTPSLAADNLRQYLAPNWPNVARVLAERASAIPGRTEGPTAS